MSKYNHGSQAQTCKQIKQTGITKNNMPIKKKFHKKQTKQHGLLVRSGALTTQTSTSYGYLSILCVIVIFFYT